MRDQKLYESVGKYIDKYYIDKPDDIKLDKEMKSIFDRISEFRKKKATKKCDAEEDTDIEIDESAVESFDVESMQKTKATDSMSSTLATNRRKLEDCWANIWFLMDPRKHRLFLKEYVDYYGDLIQLLQDDYRILHLGEIPETAKNSILERINKIIIRNRTVDKGILKCTINENVLTSNMELTIKNINEIYRHRKVWTKYLFDKSLLNSDNFTILDYKYERYLSDIVKIIDDENSLDIKYMMPIKDAEYLMSKKYLSGFSYGENNMTSGISCRFIVDHYFDMKKRFEKQSD